MSSRANATVGGWVRDYKVTIAVLNWEKWSETIRCLESIFAQSIGVDRVIVVENGSPNDSLAEITRWLDEHARAAGFAVKHYSIKDTWPEDRVAVEDFERPTAATIASTNNRGFAGGFNLALHLTNLLSPQDFVVLLNSDAVLTSKFIEVLKRQADSYADDIGLVGPKVLDQRDGSDWQRPERRRPSVWLLPLRAILIRKIRQPGAKASALVRRYWYTEDSPGEVFMVHGSCLILTRHLLACRPKLDDNLFLYWEEATLSHLVHTKGMRVWFDPNLVIYHGWGRSTSQDIKKAHLDRSTRYYFERVRNIGPLARVYLGAYLCFMRFAHWLLRR